MTASELLQNYVEPLLGRGGPYTSLSSYGKTALLDVYNQYLNTPAKAIALGVDPQAAESFKSYVDSLPTTTTATGTVVIPPRVVEPKTTARVYTPFDNQRDIVATRQTITAGIFPGSVGTLSSGELYTSSLQSSTSKDYYLTIADGSTDDDNVLFDIAYAETGSADDNVDSMYKQLLNILQTDPTTKYSFDGGSTTVDSLVAITFKRALYKERLDPGNWTMTFVSSSGTIQFVDAATVSGATSYKSQVGDRYDIYSGSVSSVFSSASVYGHVYPDLGLILFDGDTFASTVNYSASLDVFDNISSVSARNEQVMKEVNYFCRVFNKDYNYSNNPTFYTASDGALVFEDFATDPYVFPTTIGLYNADNELIATARLSKPIKKSYSSEAVLKTRLAF